MSLPDLPRRALLLDDARPGGASHLFRDPVDWIVATTPDEALAALGRIDAAVAAGRWAAGSIAFELGYLLEPKLRPLYRQPGEPLIAVGIYTERTQIDAAALFASYGERPPSKLGAAEASLDFAGYEQGFSRVHDYIAAGDVYQINLTFPLTLPIQGDPLAKLAAWRAYARAGHAAVFRLDDRDILSFSPELFLAAGDGRIRARPMKGTARRAPDESGEADAKAALQADPKQRAENLMIVDLLRNDLARVCEAGSVAVTDLFTVETYPTLHTMTSGIEGRLRPGLAPSDILRALFPCGSVTGAPKVRAMEIIAETEAGPRGIYCGAIGAFGPRGEIDLNVAIRTLVHEHGATRLRMGVGGGLVFDSQARAEYAECLLKARFAAAEPFDLLETLRWTPDGGYAFLDEHLERLARAAAYFLYPYDKSAVAAALRDHGAMQTAPRRVRLRLAANGAALVESAALWDMTGPLRLAVAATRVASGDPFTRHKTTRRAAYDAALAEAKALSADEAVLLNEHGRIADGSFTTLFVLKDGALLTPPVSEGALDGILKRVLAGRPIIETPLTLDDLKAAEALYAGNSVRGLLPAVLI